MNPAFDLSGRSLVDLQTLIDLLNKEPARTRTVATRIGDGTRAAYDRYLYFGGDSLDSPVTVFHAIHYPIEDGTIIRAAHLIPAADLPRTIAGDGYIQIAVGIRSGARFDVLGAEFDSRSNSLSEGVVYDLGTGESRIPDGMGLAVRVVQTGWPPATVEESIVETFLGYVGAS